MTQFMKIRGELYPTTQPLWHNGDFSTPVTILPPPQLPDYGGIKI